MSYIRLVKFGEASGGVGDAGAAAQPVVVHADESLLVLDKPAGLLTQPGRGEHLRDSLATRVQAAFGDALIVHRLDMATSGLIVLARGRLIAEGKPLEIRDHPKVQEVYFGSGKTFEKIAHEAAAVNAALEAQA